MAEYRTRAVEPLLSGLLGELPALLIVGPRATGKTTTASRLAATVVRLDRPAEAAAFRADPDAALRTLEEPVLLDEWQAVPEVLGAVKRSVDADPRPGRYLLTGSVRADLDAETWPGTGRLVRVPMFGMTVAEQRGNPGTAPLLDRLARGDELRVPSDPPDLRGYVELALLGGFPEAALSLSDAARQRWMESYIDQLLTRDAAQIETGRDPIRLARYFEAYAVNSAGIIHDTTLLETAGINRKTALAYEELLLNLLIAETLPSWTSNRLKRLARAPKRYLTDAALLAGGLRLDAAGIMRDGEILGRVLDTFVTSQVRAETPLAESRPRLYHLRQEEGRHEVDLLAELAGGGIVGIEIKANAAPDLAAAKHLAWLRDKLGNRFVAGVVLHTGPRSYSLADRILAAPIATLWA
ncbi:MAG: DUF4143 domain-containing protein [Actinomycetota bacterium]